MTDAVRTVGAALLAAGGSRRLGRPKQLLQLEGQSLASRAADTLLASRARPLVAVLGAEADAVAATLPADIPRVVNAEWDAGQSTSVRAGLGALLATADDRLDGVLFVPCDQPALTAATLDRSIAAFCRADSDEHIVVPVYGADRRRGAPVLFGRPFFEALSTLTGDTGGRTLLRRFADRVIELPIDDASQADDVDTVEDWRRFEDMERFGLARRSPPDLINRARELRSQSTDAEQRLWETIRDRRFHGLKFRRQHPLGSYIADFYCARLRLVLELDGPIHDAPEAQQRDRWRTENLEAEGLRVVRIDNREILDDPVDVLEGRLGALLDKREA